MDINAIIDEMVGTKGAGDRVEPFYSDVSLESAQKVAARFGNDAAVPFVAGMAIALEYVSRHRCEHCECM
jgi:hypothetical protein